MGKLRKTRLRRIVETIYTDTGPIERQPVTRFGDSIVRASTPLPEPLIDELVAVTPEAWLLLCKSNEHWMI